MIVAPTPTTPRSPGRRALRVAGIVLPVVIVVAVVGAGLLGPKVDPPSAAPSLSAARPGPDASAGAPPRRDPPAWVPAVAAPTFPDVVAGLPVRSVQDAQAELAIAGGRPAAVAGWLGGLERPASCTAEAGDTRGVLGPLCPRRARLVTADPDSPDPAAHLHVTIPPGVRLPDAFEDLASAESATAAVVLVGRASPPGADCLDGLRGCREQVTVDAVTWADGSAFDPGPIRDAGLVDTPPDIALRHLPAARALATRGDGSVLVAAVLRPATVLEVDLEAAAALDRLPPPDGLVWYVRSLNVTALRGAVEPAARIRWALFDERAGRPLASGVSGDPSRTSLVPAVPADIVGLPVREVPGTIDVIQAGPPATIDVLTGFLLAWTEPQACTDPIPGLPAVGCLRHAVLASEAWLTDGPDDTEPPGPHVHAIVPPGVVVPESALQIEGSDGIPTQVVVVLRATSRAECPSADACAPWIVERVVWADGQWLAGGRQAGTPLVPSPDDPIGMNPGAALDRAIGSTDLLLRAILLGRDQLRIVDPAASRALRRSGEDASVVWYLRGLDTRSGRAPRIRWALLAAPSDRVLVTGTVPGPRR